MDLNTQNFILMGISSEIIYSFVIMMSCLIIYFGTKELYNLSSYKGIKYFRQSFLFFGLAYFFRSFIKIILLFSNQVEVLKLESVLFGIIAPFIFMYFSSIAVLYLVYSFVWRDWKSKLNNIYFAHFAALIISIVSVITDEFLIYLITNLIIIFLGITLIFYIKKKDRVKKNTQLYIIYFLLFGFWILEIIDLFVPYAFQPLQTIFHLFCIGIFFTIMYKVLTRVGTI